MIRNEKMKTKLKVIDFCKFLIVVMTEYQSWYLVVYLFGQLQSLKLLCILDNLYLPP